MNLRKRSEPNLDGYGRRRALRHRQSGQLRGAQAQAQPAEPVQPWGLPPLPPGVGPIEQFADVGGTPQGNFLEGGSFDTDGNFWFVGIGSGWISYLTPDAKLVPVVNCNPPPEVGQDCEPQGTRWHDGKLYITSRHRGIMVYDPGTKKLKTLVYTYRNQLFKGPNDLDFDAEGNLFFTDPWGTGPGPTKADETGAVYQYSRDGVLRKLLDTGAFPNGVAVSPDDGTLAIADYAAGRIIYASFLNGPNAALQRMSQRSAAPDVLLRQGGQLRPRQRRPGRHPLRRAREPVGDAARDGRHRRDRSEGADPRLRADPERRHADDQLRLRRARTTSTSTSRARSAGGSTASRRPTPA